MVTPLHNAIFHVCHSLALQLRAHLLIHISTIVFLPHTAMSQYQNYDERIYERDSRNSQTSSDEDDDNDLCHVIPQLFVRVPRLVGPACLIPLPKRVHQRLTMDQHRFACSFSKCTYHKVKHILEAMNSGRMSNKDASELLSKALMHDTILLDLFVTTYPSIFAEGTEEYAFTLYNTPLILRPGYQAQQDESFVHQGQNYDHKVWQWGG